MIDVKFDEYFVFSDSRTRSHRLSIRCKSSCVSSYRNSFFVNIIFFWNSLIDSVLVDNYNSFKLNFCVK